MAHPYLIIDGYNLLHAAGMARPNYGPGDLQRCRHRLLLELQKRLAADVQKLATVVFDAFESDSNEQRHQAFGALTVVYAPRGTDADSEIERMLLQHSVPKRILVVSSDHRLHKAARRRRAKCVDSDDFWHGLELTPHHQATPIPAVTKRQARKPSITKDAELEFWLEEFSDTNVDAVCRKMENSDEEPAMFDTDYLRQLEDDIRRGKLR